MRTATAARQHEAPLRPLQVLGIAMLTAVLLIVAGWGLMADRGTAADIGSSVVIGDGQMVVASSWVVQDPMATMHGTSSQFARSGMQMSSMLPDAVPEGMKRVAVELSLRAGDQPLSVSASDASFTSSDGVRYAAYKALLGDGKVPAGSAMSGVVTFEVPNEVDAGLFRLAGAEQPVSVSVAATTAHHMS